MVVTDGALRAALIHPTLLDEAPGFYIVIFLLKINGAIVNLPVDCIR